MVCQVPMRKDLIRFLNESVLALSSGESQGVRGSHENFVVIQTRVNGSSSKRGLGLEVGWTHRFLVVLVRIGFPILMSLQVHPQCGGGFEVRFVINGLARDKYSQQLRG